jgi:hypothetical protein
MSPVSLTLTLLPGSFSVCRLEPTVSTPDWPAGAFVSVTRTASELSVICEARYVPAGVKAEHGWSCLRVEGPIDVAATGVAAALTAPLASAAVSVLPVATFDTDYLFVRTAQFPAARDALVAAGHRVIDG